MNLDFTYALEWGFGNIQILFCLIGVIFDIFVKVSSFFGGGLSFQPLRRYCILPQLP